MQPSVDYIKASGGSGNASLMTVQNVRSAGATTILVNTVAGAPAKFMGTMGTPHTFVDPVTSETITIISEATAVDFAGHIDTGHIEIDAIAPGMTDLGSAVGDIIIIRPTTQWADNLGTMVKKVQDDLATSDATAITTQLDSHSNFIVSGGVAAIVSGRIGSLSAVTFYLNGKKYSSGAIANKTYTASKDTYIDYTITSGVFSVIYTEVANSATAPALAANYTRLGRIVTNATDITLIRQNGIDNIGTPLRPLTPAKLDKQVDANGWTVYDYGTFKKYTKRFGPAYPTSSSIAGDATAGNLGEIGGQSLPANIVNLSQFSSFQYSVFVGQNAPIFRGAFEGNPLSGTATPNFYIRNVQAAAANVQNVYVTVELTT